MPFLHIPSLGNRREHPRLGAPTFAGVTVSPALPAAVEFFRAAGLLRATITGEEATKLIVAEIAAATSVVVAVTSQTQAAIAQATKLVEEATKLASMPVMGDERKTITGFGTIVADAMRATGIPAEASSPITYLKSVLPLAHGLDLKAIESALTDFDHAQATHEDAMAKLQAAHAKLQELAAQADDGPSRDKMAKLKASIGFQRRLPQIVEELTAGREQVAAVLARIDRALGALSECGA